MEYLKPIAAFASRHAEDGDDVCSSDLTGFVPVVITDARWRPREAFEAEHKAVARICGVPCWFKTEDGFTYLGGWWQGMYRGYRLNMMDEEIFPAPEGVVLSVLPIHPPES